MTEHEIVVGNIGVVLQTDDHREARISFVDYCKLSLDNTGRAGGESVTWMRDGELYREHLGEVAQ